MYREHTTCRACGASGLVPVLDLGVQPLANDFRSKTEERAGFAPLKLLYCAQCSLAQLSVVVKPEILFARYSYVTSPSITMQEHFHRLLDDIRTEQKPGPAVEIGSNDGLFLSFLGAHGYGNLVGIDPATNLAEKARKDGINTVNDFFCPESAKAAQQAAGDVSIVMARHVFCQIDDWHNFMVSLDKLCGKDTLVCIETPSVEDQIRNGSFDQVYHEHLSYLTIRAMKALLNRSPFHLHRIIHYPVHGGSFLTLIRRNDSSVPVHPSVDRYLETENVTQAQWERFASKSKDAIWDLQGFVKSTVSERFCGYGASAKSTVWVNACGFDRSNVEFICDSTREKVGCLSPGTDIPIVHEGDHITSCVDYVIMFCWNYAEEVRARERNYLLKQVDSTRKSWFKWIIPVPKLAVVDV